MKPIVFTRAARRRNTLRAEKQESRRFRLYDASGLLCGYDTLRDVASAYRSLYMRFRGIPKDIVCYDSAAGVEVAKQRITELFY